MNLVGALRPLAVLCGLLLAVCTLAYADNFAALNVTPRGDQTLDLATGVTTLPQGGEIVDTESGLKLEGSFIRYHAGEFIEARGATVHGKFGDLKAAKIYLDAAKQTLQASGGVNFSAQDFNVTAGSLTVYLEPELAFAGEQVHGDKPALEASALLVDSSGRQALLASPYHYQDGPLTLQSQAAGHFLMVRWAEGGSSFSASTEVDPKLLAEFKQYGQGPSRPFPSP